MAERIRRPPTQTSAEQMVEPYCWRFCSPVAGYGDPRKPRRRTEQRCGTINFSSICDIGHVLRRSRSNSISRSTFASRSSTFAIVNLQNCDYVRRKSIPNSILSVLQLCFQIKNESMAGYSESIVRALDSGSHLPGRRHLLDPLWPRCRWADRAGCQRRLRSW